MSFTEKLAQRMQEKSVELEIPEKGIDDNVEAFESSPFFKADNLRNAPSCIDLRLSSGLFKSIPYTYVFEIDYDPSEGIIIFTSTKKICITGRNLKMLYNYLSAFRVRFVQANIGSDTTEEKSLFVKDIRIEEV